MTDELTILPLDIDAHDPRAPQKPRPATLGGDFAYIGKALTLAEFEAYVSAYNFGTVKPDYVVFHHTASPDASWAPLNANPAIKWDRDEAGVVDIKAKRVRQLDGIKAYYQNTLGWNAGPHLFVDDRYIYLFTPMYDVGIHAKWGNSFRAFGKLHYSIGIEVIGYYDKVAWPAPVQALVGGAVRALQRRLQTFELKYLYPTPQSKPGLTTLPGGVQKCTYPSRMKWGGLTSHADYNKPACPGKMITPTFYVGVCRG